jgi:hypothetical protein
MDEAPRLIAQLSTSCATFDQGLEIEHERLVTGWSNTVHMKPLQNSSNPDESHEMFSKRNWVCPNGVDLKIPVSIAKLRSIDCHKQLWVIGEEGQAVFLKNVAIEDRKLLKQVRTEPQFSTTAVSVPGIVEHACITPCGKYVWLGGQGLGLFSVETLKRRSRRSKSPARRKGSKSPAARGGEKTGRRRKSKSRPRRRKSKSPPAPVNRMQAMYAKIQSDAQMAQRTQQRLQQEQKQLKELKKKKSDPWLLLEIATTGRQLVHVINRRSLITHVVCHHRRFRGTRIPEIHGKRPRRRTKTSSSKLPEPETTIDSGTGTATGIQDEQRSPANAPPTDPLLGSTAAASASLPESVTDTSANIWTYDPDQPDARAPVEHVLQRLALDKARGVLDEEQREIVEELLQSADPEDVEEAWFRVALLYEDVPPPRELGATANTPTQEPITGNQGQRDESCTSAGTTLTDQRPEERLEEAKQEEELTQYLVAFSTPHFLFLYDYTPLMTFGTQGEPILLLKQPCGSAALAFSHDGLTLFSGQRSSVGEYSTGICLWSTQTGELQNRVGTEEDSSTIREVTQLKRWGTNCLFSTQQESFCYSVRLWNIKRLQCVGVWHMQPRALENIAISPTGRYTVSLQQNEASMWYSGPLVQATENSSGFSDQWMADLDTLGQILHIYFPKDLCPLIFGFAQVSFKCIKCQKEDCTRELDAVEDAVVRMQECRYHRRGLTNNGYGGPSYFPCCMYQIPVRHQDPVGYKRDMENHHLHGCVAGEHQREATVYTGTIVQ